MDRFHDAKRDYTHRPPPSVLLARSARSSRFGRWRTKLWRTVSRAQDDRDVNVRTGSDMWLPLGETLTWICALDELLRDNDKTYEKRRDNDRGGRLIPGLRFIRNHILHGETTVFLSRQRTLSSSLESFSEMFMPRALAWAIRSQYTLYYHMTWIDADLLPKTDRPSRLQETTYRNYLANGWVVLSLSTVFQFLHTELGNDGASRHA
jgi:hypothetical protein